MADLNEISDNFYQFSYKSYLAEIKNSDKPEEHHFPSKTAFFEDFSNKVNAAYNDISRNYPPEVAKYIYESMLFNLNKYSQNPAQCHIIDPSTGSINYTNLQANSKRIAEALQAKYPDKFVEVNAVKEESSVKDSVDFSKPEEANKYFNRLFQEYNELQTEEEKEKFKRENFYNYDENKEIIDLGCDIEARAIEIQKEQPEKKRQECIDLSCEEINKETGKNIEELKITCELTEIYAQINELSKQISTSLEHQELSNKINKLLEEATKLEQEINNKKNNDNLESLFDENVKLETQTTDLEDIFNEDFNTDKQDDELENILNGNIELEMQTTDLEDIFNEDFNTDKQDDELESILKGDIEPEIVNDDNELDNNTPLEQIGEEEFTANELNSETSALIEYKPNRLKVFFTNLINKIKESNLFKKMMNRTIPNESSTQKLDQLEENKTTFEASLVVSKEEQEKNRIENEKNKSPNKSISLSFGEKE